MKDTRSEKKGRKKGEEESVKGLVEELRWKINWCEMN